MSVHIEDEVIIKGTYERLFMVGADAAIPIGDFVVRLEGALFPQRHFQVKPEYQAKKVQAGEECAYSEKENQTLALAGFDWDAGNGFTITAQYVADMLVGTKEKLDTLERKEYEHTATLSVDKSLCNDNLSLSLSGAVDLNQYSSVYQLSTSYKLSDSIKLSAIGDVFLEGPDNKAGKYGIYRDLSCITLKGVFSF
ncbi:MAG: hypothetical protein K6E51_09960 [Treponema sp.]|nr:hypothetical protein [Treponema sp.]